jgi:hypothetical protein
MPTPHDPTGAAAPDTTPTDVPVAEAAAQAAAAPEAPTDPSPLVEPVDQDAAAIAAFDKGIEEVASTPASEPRTAADVAAAAASHVDATSATAAPPAAAGAPLVVDHGATPPAAVPVRDAETDAAVTELGLKGKAETRFREMAGTIKTQAQELEPLRADAERGRRWEEMVLNTGAPPEQFGNALGYLAAVNSGDPVQMNKAFDTMVNELGWLAGQLGRELPGVVDPLAAHQDLAQEVQNGYITKDRALELARVRATDARRNEASTRTNEQAEQQRIYDQSMTDVASLNSRLKAEDPATTRRQHNGWRPSSGPGSWFRPRRLLRHHFRRLQSCRVSAPCPSAPPAPASPCSVNPRLTSRPLIWASRR